MTGKYFVGCGQKLVLPSCDRALKLVVTQEGINRVNWFFADTNSRKLRVIVIVAGWAWSKMGIKL